jgi:serine/threonine protein kinase/Tol biopolymer transport system component
MTPERWRQIERCYNAALERPPESRTAFLDKACGQDPALKKEVESLLGYDRDAASFLETHAGAGTKPLHAGPAAGAQLGPYRVLSPLGAGGMGEVYRAHDSNLGRDVALKTLPQEFARDPDRLARLRREARSLAALNHPNIATVYGLEEFDGATCIILELVEGEALRGPLPIQKALDCARQVAEALEAAHEKGIIHRDLKPSNVRVTPQGRVKVLDFGLAKAVDAEDRGGPSHLPDTTALETIAGQILGTPSYMSPEQGRGQRVDQRTDIWAFGCLLYELLAGKRAFRGESMAEAISAVLECEPDWQALPPKTPAVIRELLRACLLKDPDRRPQSMAQARQIIEAAMSRPRRRWQIAAALAVVAVSTAAGLWMRGHPRPDDRSRWVRITNFPDSVSQPALSPDGRMLAFVRSSDTFAAPGQIYVKMLTGGEAVELTHDGLRKMSPAFSPDGTQIAYTAIEGTDWNTWLVSALNGQPHRWLLNASGLLWFGRGRILYARREDNDIHMAIVNAAEDRAGARHVYVPASVRGMAHRSYPSPDGKWALVVEMDRAVWLPCRLVPMDGSSPGHQVGPPGARCTFAAWSPDGKWMYMSSNAGGSFHTWRQRFPNGRPEQITSGPSEEEGVAISADGGSFITAVGQRQSVIWVRDPNGERQVSLEGYSYDPKFTPDGKKLCYRILRGATPIGDPSELQIVDLTSGHRDPLLPGFPVSGLLGETYDISPDGQRVAAIAPDSDGKDRLWVAPLDRSSPPHQIPNVDGNRLVFGPDHEIFFRRKEGTSIFVFRVHEDGSGLRKAIERPIANLTSISPDGQWLLVLLPGETYAPLTAFPLGGGAPIRIFGGGIEQGHASWSANGRMLFVWVATSMSMSAGITYAIPLPPGRMFPEIPPGGFQSEAELARLPGVRVIAAFATPGPTPETYAYSRETVERNLYRIPLR